jgi:hypothetical protein
VPSRAVRIVAGATGEPAARAERQRPGGRFDLDHAQWMRPGHNAGMASQADRLVDTSWAPGLWRLCTRGRCRMASGADGPLQAGVRTGLSGGRGDGKSQEEYKA